MKEKHQVFSRSLAVRSWFPASSRLLLASCLLALGCSAGDVDGTRTDGPASSGTGGAGSGSLTGDDGSGSDLGLADPTASDLDSDECAGERADTEPLPVDLMILLDQSGSMTLDDPNRWDPVTAAMKGFVGDPSLRNLRLGLQYFPLGATTTEDPAICLPANYVDPDVPFTSVPEGVSLVQTSIDDHYFTAAEGEDAAHWGTPTRPALEGTYEYLAGWASEHPESSPILVLATDGRPSKICYDDDDDLDGIAEITQVIENAATGTPPIKTYVIGIGEVDRLDEWALAGGTGKSAFIVNAANPDVTEAEFKEAMNEIRAAEVPCEYPIPEATSTIDFDEVNVEFTDLNGERTLLTQVPGEQDCAKGLNWFYDDPDNPRLVGLCPSACEQINTAGGAVEIVFGCKTVVR